MIRYDREDFKLAEIDNALDKDGAEDVSAAESSLTDDSGKTETAAVPNAEELGAMDECVADAAVGAEGNIGETVSEVCEEGSDGRSGVETVQPQGESDKKVSGETAQAVLCEDETNSVEQGKKKIADASESETEVSRDKKPKVLTNEEVTGHTAGLWKYKPVPEDEPEPVPEYINGTYTFSGIKAIAARVRGKKHKHEGTNCDDWYEVANYGDIIFVAVSDGAGSKKFSRIGARESCKAAIGYMVNSFKTIFEERKDLRRRLSLELSDPQCMESYGVLAGIVQNSVIKAYEAVESAFYSRSVSKEYSALLNRDLKLSDLSATLLLAVMIPINNETGERLVISCQIGDGMITLIDSKGEFSGSLKLMGVPDSGDFSGETEFLVSPQMKKIESLQSRTKLSRSTADTMLVMTDGVADDYFPNETEMLRLYFDLVINGILPKESAPGDVSSLTQQQLRIFKKIPDPLAYPWVNDQSVKVPIQYTKRICDAAGVSLEDIWNDPTIIDLAVFEMDQINKDADPGELLKVWLDNYVERGSFDDRTLVIVKA